ncbi:MAG: cysteine desulfurase [Myxococcales bacterium]|nr:cysteine desulfurase [Myxococcales bacterium]
MGVGATTPGASFAGARWPGGPTLPDPADPLGLTRLVGALANELFRAPPTPPGARPDAPTAVEPRAPGGAPPPAIALLPVPATESPRSPFDAPLRFDDALLVSPSSLDERFGLDAAALQLVPTDEATAAAVPPAVPPAAPAAAPPLPPADAAAPHLEHRAEPRAAERAHVDFVDLSAPPATLLATPVRAEAREPFDAHALKREFPILAEPIRGKRLVWLDNAATTQKPRAVIDRLTRFYEHENSNVHRAAHTLAARATDAYEAARETTRRFLNAPSTREIVFVRGTTEGINLVAQSWGRRNVGPGDEIVVSWLEHHANIVPWQQLCAEKGARLRVAPVDDSGELLLDEYEKLLGPRTRLVSFTQVSNALGTVTPARQMIEMAHRHGAKVLLDGAQSVSHMPVDVQALGCDFFVFSGHKVFAPTGIGALFGRAELLDTMPPWQGGGNMIQDVTFERTVYQAAPNRFEAGTGNIADAAGLGAALEWLTRVGVERVGRHEHELLEYGTARLATVPGLRMIGTAREKAGVLSFVLAGQKTEEVGGMLDQEGIAVRSGHHCAQPILRRFGLEATVRASLAPYNTGEDIDALVDALRRIQVGKPSGAV